MDLQDLLKLKKESPDKFRKAVLELPDETKRLILHYADVIKAGSEFSPEGYKAFFLVIFGKVLPDHAYYSWVVPLFYSRGVIGVEKFKKYYEGVGEKFSFVMDECLKYDIPNSGLVAEAFRESIKSTTLTIGFMSYFLGHHPDTSNLLIQVADTPAQQNSAKLAEIISDNPGWKAIFPHVVPNKESAWGAEGYNVIDTRVPVAEWSKLIATRKEKSFVGRGYASRSNIGEHPNGLMIVDDICDENNTSSETELNKVLHILSGTLFYMITKNTWVIFVGTPWVIGDVIEYVKNTGEYTATKIPAYWQTDSGTTYAWPEERGEDWVKIKRKITISSEYARMVLLDLSKAGSGSLKYYPFDKDALLEAYDYPCVGGADPINVMPNSTDGKKRSYFALAYVVKLPQGGAVVFDGVLKQCSQLEAENYIAQAQTKFSNYLHTAIENVGGGALFIQVARRNSSLRIIDSNLQSKKGGRIKSKADRFLSEVAPWFENGVVRISTENTPFLNALRRLFDRFYDLDPKSDLSFDAGDAVYHALKTMPDVLHITQSYELPSVKGRIRVSQWDMQDRS